MTRNRATAHNILAGAAYGAAAWIVYSGVELFLSTSVQLWRHSETEVTGWQWSLIATLFGIYAACGFLVGAAGSLLAGRLKRQQTHIDHRIWAVLTISLAVAANLISGWPLARSEQIALGVAAFLAAGFVAALVSDQWRKRTQFLVSPWTVSLLLLGVPWLSREVLSPLDSSLKKVGLSLLLLLAIGGLARLSDGFRAARTMGGQVATIHGQFALALLVFGAFLAAVAARSKDPVMLVDRTALAKAGPVGPNILLITMDTVRADHLSLYGYQLDTSPNLREFARGATVYNRAIAVSDFTLATHASLFTGLYPDWNGAIQSPLPNPIALPLDDQHATLAQVLRSLGYWTGEVAANFGFLGQWTGLTRGFATREIREPMDLSTFERRFYLREGLRRLLSPAINLATLDRTTLSAADINRRALAALEEAKAKGAPFFLFLNYMDAHSPYVPGPPFDSRFPGEDRRIEPASLNQLMLQVDSGKRQLQPSETRHMIAEYDGGIAAEDDAIGALLNRLRGLGLFDNTLIVITGDHGNSFGEHDLLDHFIGFVYQSLVHVPLVIKYPGQHDPAQSDELVSQVDFMPTVLDLLEAKPPAQLQGRSLLQSAGTGSAVYSRGTRSSIVGVGNPRFLGLRRAIFSGSLKLITWTNGPPEFYNLAVDPTEQHNLYAADDPDVRELSQRLQKWIADMPRHAAQPRQLDKATSERLKSLGYVQ